MRSRRMRKHYKGPTKSARKPKPEEPADDPVTLLIRLPDGPIHDLESLGKRGQIVHTVGRFCQNSIWIEDDERVSRNHCMLFYDPVTGHLQVTDSDSKDGTFVNRRRARREQYPVYSGNVIKLGKTRLLVCGRDREEQRADIIARTLKEWVLELKDIYGSFRAAEKRNVGKSNQTLSRWSRGGDDGSVPDR